MHRMTIGLAALLLLVAATASAQSGATLTPDGLSFLVNKDIGNERWTIALNLTSQDPDAFNNVTGNVFKRDGSPPSFVLCQVRLDSPGDLTQPSSDFRLQCSGTSACQSTAKECAREDWVPIGGDIQIPADFFLPPGGLGSLPVVAARPAGEADQEATSVASALGSVRSWLGALVASVFSGPPAAVAQGADRGATLSLDGFNYLVNKDLGGLRWSISLNFVPMRTAAGSIETRIASVTGNVFDPNGQPSFIYCTERGDSAGTLNDPGSSFRLSCVGTDACDSTASGCAATEWRAIPGGDDVQVPASFFLPPGGLPAPVQSDPEIFVIGRTSDPPAIVTSDFTLPGGDAALGRAAGGCPVGATCLATSLGTCSNVEGEVVEETGFGCGCLVDPVPSACITCGLQCGGSCDFPVGDATARGTCLPLASSTDECGCFAIGAGAEKPIDACGGTLGVTCPGDLCCADDPSDGCDPARGDLSCLGICVDGGGCDPTLEDCGICRAPEVPGGGGPGPMPTRTPGPICGNGIAESGEECDGADVRGAECSDFDLAGGAVACTENCRFDLSPCVGLTPTPTPTRTPTPTPSPTFTPTPSPTHAPTRPVVTDVSFPSVIFPDIEYDGVVLYTDPDRDVVFAEFVQVSGPFTPFSFQVQQNADPDSFEFVIFCFGSEPFSATVGVILTDSTGLQSPREDFTFTCQAGDS